MAHARQVIRDKIAELLRTNLPEPLNEVVVVSRETPLRRDGKGRVLQIGVYTTGEDVLDQSFRVSPREYYRVVSVQIECVCNVTPVDDSLDNLAYFVEDVLCQDYTLEGVCQDIRYTGTKFDYDRSGERVIAVAALTYDVEYQTGPVDHSGDAVWLNRIGGEFDLAGAQAIADRVTFGAEIREGDAGPDE
jgi:hypothetical protein